MNGKIKVSVVGVGHLGSIHAKLWNESAFADLVGIYDVDTEKAQIIADGYGCKCFGSIEELIENSEAVTIAAPTTLHYDISLKCIEKNVHCLIEKPITGTYEQAQILIEAAKKHNVLIQVGHVERFNPALLAIKNYELNPLFIEVHRLSQFRPRAIDVSVIHDLMIHDIDIILWLVKSPVEKIDANVVPVLTDTPDIANARITFKNGAVANLTASRISAKPMRKMRIFQRNAYISMDFGKQDVEVFRLLDDGIKMPTDSIPATMLGSLEAGLHNNRIVYEKPPVPQINAIAEEQNAFAQAVLEKSPVAVSAQEAAEALRIAEIISEQVFKG